MTNNESTMTEEEYVARITEFRDTMLDLKALHQTNPIWAGLNGEMFIKLMEHEIADPQVTEHNITNLPKMEQSLSDVEALLNMFSTTPEISA